MATRKWLRRVRQDGWGGGLEDRCRAPLHCPHRTDAEVVETLVEARLGHPYWGGKQLLWLAKRQPDQTLPAASAAGDILKRRVWSGPTPTTSSFASRPGHLGGLRGFGRISP